jgi:hypothetical protein
MKINKAAYWLYRSKQQNKLIFSTAHLGSGHIEGLSKARE